MIKNIIKKLVYGHKYNSDSYIKYLRKIGVNIGDNCIIYAPTKTTIDEQNPFMLEIGNNVKITEGVKILTHDFSWCVLANDGHVLGGVGYVKIGNNVFIGMNSIILKNTIVEDNVIIGAGSVVTGKCEKNSVYAGNPAKKIMNIEEYRKKRAANQKKEASNIILEYMKKHNERPSINHLREYIYLFKDRSVIDDVTKKVLVDSGFYDECVRSFVNSKPEYDGFNDLIDKTLSLKENGGNHE